MGSTVFDCRNDLRNVLITPQIRARLCRMEPGSGTHDQYHTHDLGHEIFLILAGRVEFKISGRLVELGPGQLCYALAGEPHSVRVLGEEPVYMYLSVTPHIQPTHTFYSENGQPLPPLFRPSSDYDAQADPAPAAELVERCAAAARQAARAAQASAQLQEELAGALKQALAAGNTQEVGRLREAIWTSLLATFKGMDQLAAAWNELAPRAGQITAFY